MNIKLDLNSAIHKVSTKPKSYQELLDVITRTFKKEKLPSSFDIKYMDEEKDMIIIQDDDGFSLALETFKQEKLSYLKIYIIPTESEPQPMLFDQKAEKSASNITNDSDKKGPPISSDTSKVDFKASDSNEFSDFNNIPKEPFHEEIANRPTIIKKETKSIEYKEQQEPKPANEQLEKLDRTIQHSIITPGGNFEDPSDLDKIFHRTGLTVTPDFDVGPVNDGIEGFDMTVAKEIERGNQNKKAKMEDLEKIDTTLLLQIPTNSKEKEIISPLKPSINITMPLATLKEEESIIEEKSSESQSKDDDLKDLNIQILDAFDNESIPKNLCLKCKRCAGTGINKKKDKPCSKCVKGYLKVDKKLTKLINHVLTYKLTTKYKKLLEINDEIGKGSLTLADDREKNYCLLPLESSQKNSEIDLKNSLDNFVCHICAKEYGSEEIRYRSMEAEIYYCEKCESESNFTGQDLIKIKPLVLKQAALNPNSSNLKSKSMLRKSETLSASNNSENWGSSSMCLPNKTNEIKAKLIGNPPSITTTPDSKIFQFIEVCNSGNVKWPNNVNLICVSGEFMEEFKEVASLEKGARHEIRLELVSPSKVGKYYSAWRLSSLQDREEKKFFGPRISFEINVESNDNKKGNKKSISNEQNIKVSVNKSTNNTSSDFRIYNDCDRSLLNKAKEIHKIMPEHDESFYIEYLKKGKNREKSFDEIMNAFLG